jgi:Histidine kinase-, DNA gyrase B-, and HSP90-like ATPase
MSFGRRDLHFRALVSVPLWVWACSRPERPLGTYPVGVLKGAFRIRARLPAGPDVTITVADTGDGIAADHLPHIFERFYRADTARDRAHGGSGIGLTIARALIAAHGSTLTAASGGPGTGAQFTITLPGAQIPDANPPSPLPLRRRCTDGRSGDPSSRTTVGSPMSRASPALTSRARRLAPYRRRQRRSIRTSWRSSGFSAGPSRSAGRG